MPSPGRRPDDLTAAAGMEADAGAGPLRSMDSSVLHRKLPSSGTTDSAESDLAGVGAAQALLQESPPTEGEMQDAMSRINDFFASPSTLGHITDSLHTSSSSAGCRVARPQSQRTAPLVSKVMPVARPFGPPPRSTGLAPPSPNQHRGDTNIPATVKASLLCSDAGGALGGDIMSAAIVGVRTRSKGGDASGDPNARQDMDYEPVTPRDDPSAPSLLPLSELSLPGGEEDVPCEHDTHDPCRVPRCNLGMSPEWPDHQAQEKDASARGILSSSSTAQRRVVSGFPTPCVSNRPVPTIDKDANAPNFQSKMRLGITPSGNPDDLDMRYIHVHEHSRDKFQQFAKAFIGQLSVECAESNPYVKALCAHRQELSESALDLQKEAVDSLAARLGTERVDNLATMTVSQEQRRNNCDINCHGDSPCEATSGFVEGELFLPELEARHRRYHRGFVLNSPTPPVSDRSTTAGSARSDPEARRVSFTLQDGASKIPNSLRFRNGRSRMTLVEDDRSDFLDAITKPDRPSGASAAGSGIRKSHGIRSATGDIAPTPRLDLD